jgi:hypothetical protein
MMRRFERRQLREALAWAASGGQALHCHRVVRPGCPPVFRSAVARGQQVAHLFDQDRRRLGATARRLGVRIILVEQPGTDRQHIDLCLGPLSRALAECQQADPGI